MLLICHYHEPCTPAVPPMYILVVANLVSVGYKVSTVDVDNASFLSIATCFAVAAIF